MPSFTSDKRVTCGKPIKATADAQALLDNSMVILANSAASICRVVANNKTFAVTAGTVSWDKAEIDTDGWFTSATTLTVPTGVTHVHLELIANPFLLYGPQWPYQNLSVVPSDVSNIDNLSFWISKNGSNAFSGNARINYDDTRAIQYVSPILEVSASDTLRTGYENASSGSINYQMIYWSVIGWKT